MKFGKPTKEELDLKFCPFDTSAPAMILCNYGYFHAERFEFDEMIRIKFFKKEGYDWANFQNLFFDRLPQIAAYTYNLENGEIVEEKLKQTAIFKTKVGKESMKISFALPNIKEGSVIDVKISYQGFPKD